MKKEVKTKLEKMRKKLPTGKIRKGMTVKCHLSHFNKTPIFTGKVLQTQNRNGVVYIELNKKGSKFCKKENVLLHHSYVEEIVK